MFLFGNKYWLPSLKAQWVMGALLAMLPLIAAMVYGFNVMDHHNRAQRELVVVSAAVAEIGASMADEAKDMERVARQFQVLKDDRLRQAFEQKNDDLIHLLNRIAGVSGHANLSGQATLLRQVSAQLEQALFNDSGENEGVPAHFKQLHQTIQQMHQDARTWVQAELNALEQNYLESQWHLLVMGSAALPATLLLVWLVSFMVLRPIYQLSTSIRQMGRGEWRTDIRITGSNEMMSLGENLKWMQQQLLMLEAQKHTFLQQITHELKTPLAAIMEAGSLLEDEVPGEMNHSQRQVLGILQSNAGHLQGLIQQLLDYNSVVKDQTQQVREMDLRSFCAEKLLDLQGLAETRNVKLVLTGGSFPLLIDIVRVGMILRNLVSNGVQLTPPGKQVTVKWGMDSTTNSWWLQVEDEGPGIQKEEMARLFEPFYQGGAKRQGSLKGSGIGLAIVRECVEFLNGGIEVENLSGRAQGQQSAMAGARFTVTLPVIVSAKTHDECISRPELETPVIRSV